MSLQGKDPLLFITAVVAAQMRSGLFVLGPGMSDMAESANPAEFAVDVSPENTALLVIDKQNDFCAKEGYVQRVLGMEVSQSSDVAGSINQLVEVARDKKNPCE